jgi:hypothetical protein
MAPGNERERLVQVSSFEPRDEALPPALRVELESEVYTSYNHYIRCSIVPPTCRVVNYVHV